MIIQVIECDMCYTIIARKGIISWCTEKPYLTIRTDRPLEYGDGDAYVQTHKGKKYLCMECFELIKEKL